MKTHVAKPEIPKGAIRKTALAFGLTRKQLMDASSWCSKRHGE